MKCQVCDGEFDKTSCYYLRVEIECQNVMGGGEKLPVGLSEVLSADQFWLPIPNPRSAQWGLLFCVHWRPNVRI